MYRTAWLRLFLLFSARPGKHGFGLFTAVNPFEPRVLLTVLLLNAFAESDGPCSIMASQSLDLRTVRVPVVSITSPDGSLKEKTGNSGGGDFTISRTGPTDEPLVITLSSGGTATSGSDYVALPASITIPVGQSSVALPVVVINDFDAENTENLSVVIYSSADYVVGMDSGATATILSNDVWQWAAHEGNDSSGSAAKVLPALDSIGSSSSSNMSAKYSAIATDSSFTIKMSADYFDANPLGVGNDSGKVNDCDSMNFDFDPLTGNIYQTGGKANGPNITQHQKLQGRAVVSAAIDNVSSDTRRTVVLTWGVAAIVSTAYDATYGIKLDVGGRYKRPDGAWQGQSGLGSSLSSLQTNLAGAAIEWDGTITLILQCVEISI